jgi:hypothetical protein
LTNFKCNLPVGAVVKKIIVEYNHRKIGVQNHSPSVSVDTKMNIPAPTISLVGVSGYSGKGQAPTNKWKHQTKTFKTNINREKINSKDRQGNGKYYIRIRVENPSYCLTFPRLSEFINLPMYDKSLNMYRGLETGKKYSIDYLVE